jgi:hypothetical protein
MKSVFASVLALVVCATAFSRPAVANEGAAFLGGLLLGGVLQNQQRQQQPPQRVIIQPARSCWWEKQFVGYDQYGQQVWQKVQVCQ